MLPQAASTSSDSEEEGKLIVISSAAVQCQECPLRPDTGQSLPSFVASISYPATGLEQKSHAQKGTQKGTQTQNAMGCVESNGDSSVA